jgi:hypothetical protein
MKILEYYRNWFKLLLSIFLVSIIIPMILNWNLNLEALFYSLLLALGTSIILGSLFYKYDIYFGPKKRSSELKKYPFNEFLKIGFEEKEYYLIGKINGFTTIISYDWRGRNGLPCAYGLILFEPQINEKYLNNYDLNKLQQKVKNKFNLWEYGRLRTEWSYMKGKPNHKLMIAKLNKNSNSILNEGMKRISLENWKKEIEKSQ